MVNEDGEDLDGVGLGSDNDLDEDATEPYVGTERFKENMVNYRFNFPNEHQFVAMYCP